MTSALSIHRTPILSVSYFFLFFPNIKWVSEIRFEGTVPDAPNLPSFNNHNTKQEIKKIREVNSVLNWVFAKAQKLHGTDTHSPNCL